MQLFVDTTIHLVTIYVALVIFGMFTFKTFLKLI